MKIRLTYSRRDKTRPYSSNVLRKNFTGDGGWGVVASCFTRPLTTHHAQFSRTEHLCVPLTEVTPTLAIIFCVRNRSQRIFHICYTSSFKERPGQLLETDLYLFVVKMARRHYVIPPHFASPELVSGRCYFVVLSDLLYFVPSSTCLPLCFFLHCSLFYCRWRSLSRDIHVPPYQHPRVFPWAKIILCALVSDGRGDPIILAHLRLCVAGLLRIFIHSFNRGVFPTWVSFLTTVHAAPAFFLLNDGTDRQPTTADVSPRVENRAHNRCYTGPQPVHL